MVYLVHTPRLPLSQFIESFIYYRGYQPDHTLDRFLPDGNVHVVIDLTEQPKYIYDNQTLKEIQSCRRVWFSGIRRAPITIPSGKDSEMFIINFHKGMAYPFVEMPMDELTDLVVDGQLVMTDEILTIRDKILESKDSTQMFKRAESHLLDVFGARLVPHPYIAYAVGRIVQQPGALTMEALAKKVGYSGKHLVKLFRDHVGLTPKTFLRIIRFQQAIADMESHRNMDWSSIAHDSGYYDQAHFINDFRHFSGFTPQEYASLQGNYRNYVAVG